MSESSALPSSPLPDLGRIGIIGAGRLGTTLAVAWAQAGLTVAAVHSRREASARELARRVSQWAPVPMMASSPQELVAACDTVFITVHDDQIEAVANGVVWRSGQRVVHCSGATELSALAGAGAGIHKAGFHPLHTFGDVDTALAGLPGCAVAVESPDAGVREALFQLALRVQARPFELPAGSRALYHASAHYAGSLVVTLVDEAVRHWGRFGVPSEQALAALLPLLKSTVRAIESRGLGPGMAGVAARADVGTLEAHREALQQTGQAQWQLYADLTQRSIRLALESGRIDEQQAHAMSLLLKPAGTD